MTGLQGTWLVTGGAGFIARALYARARREGWKARFIAYSRDDRKHVPLQQRYPEVLTLRGDVRDLGNLIAASAGVDGIIHAAAEKYVDRSEFAVRDTVGINVIGSQNVIDAAVHNRIPTVIGISTDKSSDPRNVYGMTKSLMERLFQDMHQPTRQAASTRFLCVRYGNVVASTGSVIPLFRKQLAEHGKVFVTNPDMTRYWLSHEEAIDLILLANDRGRAGSVVVRDLRAMTLANLAHAVAGADKMEIVGVRPGEKVHESLISPSEALRTRIVSQWAGQKWYEILPPGAKLEGGKAIDGPLQSDRPRAWISAGEMYEMIENAEGV